MPSRPAVIAEFLGTFALVVGCITPAVVAGFTDGAVDMLAIAIGNGLAVMVMIYAIGEVSGAHINPAVTLAFAVARRLSWATVPCYIAAQCLGAIAGAGCVLLLFGDHGNLGANVPAEGLVPGRALGIEILLSWMLMFVILGVCTGAKEKGLMAGVAIGSVVALDVLLGAAYTGGSMNPARSLGPALFAGELRHMWLYVLGPCIGTCLAVACLCLVQPRRCCSKEGATACGSRDEESAPD